MTKEKLLGVVRELIAAVGGALVAWGYGIDSWFPEVSGAVLAIVSLIWGIVANEGIQTVLTLVRKVLSATGGAAVALGFLTPEKMDAIIGLGGAIISSLALAWSVRKSSVAKAPADE